MGLLLGFVEVTCIKGEAGVGFDNVGLLGRHVLDGSVQLGVDERETTRGDSHAKVRIISGVRS